MPEPVPGGTGSGMNVLAMLAHPSMASYTARSVEAFTRGAVAAGHRVELGDLYRERFDPVFDLDDFAQFTNDQMPADVLREQARVDRNDALVLAFPLYWWSFPAMLKGWLDRVWSAGWAYKSPEDTRVLQRSRPCVVLCSAGSREEVFDRYNYRDPFEHLLRVGMLSYCGITDVRIHLVFEMDMHNDSEAVERSLRDVETIGRTAFLAAPNR